MTYDSDKCYFSLCFTDLKWEPRQDVKFKMVEPHGLDMCYKLNDFILHEGVTHFKLKVFHPYSTWYLVQLTLFLLLCVKPICFGNSWEICFRGGSRQTLPNETNETNFAILPANKVHFSLVLLRAKSFQNWSHSCSVFGSSSTLVLYHINSIYCISGLNCIQQVNAHHCYVLACPILLNLILFTAFWVNYVFVTIDNLPHPILSNLTLLTTCRVNCTLDNL